MDQEQWYKELEKKEEKEEMMIEEIEIEETIEETTEETTEEILEDHKLKMFAIIVKELVTGNYYNTYMFK